MGKHALNQVKMYYIDTEPPIQYRNNTNQTRNYPSLSPPQVFAIESSPTPSSDHSTLTNSFHSTGQQSYPLQQHQQLQGEKLLPLPVTAEIHNPQGVNYRHSSSSIDHKTLNLLKFHERNPGLCNLDSQPKYTSTGTFAPQTVQQHQVRPPGASQPPAWVAARRSNSFRLKNRGVDLIEISNQPGGGGGAGSKRTRVNFAHSPTQTRNSGLHRLLTSPVPQPPKPPARRQMSVEPASTMSLDTGQPHKMAPPTEHGPQRAGQGAAQAEPAPAAGQPGNHASEPGVGSLDNIEMIVDEVSVPFGGQQLVGGQSSAERFLFVTTDEPYKMSTIRHVPVNRTPAITNTTSDVAMKPHQSPVRYHPGCGHIAAPVDNEHANSSSGNFLSGVEHAVHFDDLNLRQEMNGTPTYNERQVNAPSSFINNTANPPPASHQHRQHNSGGGLVYDAQSNSKVVKYVQYQQQQQPHPLQQQASLQAQTSIQQTNRPPQPIMSTVPEAGQTGVPQQQQIYGNPPMMQQHQLKAQQARQDDPRQQQQQSQQAPSPHSLSPQHIHHPHFTGYDINSTSGDPTNVCGIFLTAISLILVICTFPLSMFFCIKVVQEYERVVIFRLGRLVKGGARGPGIFFIIPCIDTYCKVDLRTVSFDVPPQEILSKDSVTVAVDAVVYYRISNATIAVSNVEDYGRSTRLLAATTLRNVLGTKNLSEILSERETISHIMQSSLDEATEPWGVKVERVEIKDVRLPVQLQRAMAAEAEAAREARAKVIAAEGEQKASKALRMAAEVISMSPQALQLRYLQTLNSIAAEKNSTIVFPLPLEIFSGFQARPLAPIPVEAQQQVNQSAQQLPPTSVSVDMMQPMSQSSPTAVAGTMQKDPITTV